MSDIIDVRSPIERIMKEALQHRGFMFSEEVSVYINKIRAPYLIDFVVYGEVCKIAIECDGKKYHSGPTQKTKDAIRDLHIINSGYQDILRFTGREIYNNISNCVDKIATEITKYDSIKLKQNNRKIIDLEELRSKHIDKSEIKEIIDIFNRECMQTYNNSATNVRRKDLLKELRRKLRNNGIVVNEQMVYFLHSNLKSMLDKDIIDFHFTAYNLTYSVNIFINYNGEIQLPPNLLIDEKLIKLIILIKSYLTNIDETRHLMRNWILVEGKTGYVIDSDLLIITQRSNDYVNCDHRAAKYTIVSNDNKKDMHQIKGSESIGDKSISELRMLALEIGNTGKDVFLLEQLFMHTDYEIRRRACSAAAKIQDKNIVMNIVPCLFAQEPQIRQYALKAILQSKCYVLNSYVSKVLEHEEKIYNIKLCHQILSRKSFHDI